VALTENTDRAEPITRLLGKRVAEHRKLIGMNQTELGARMAKLRPGWSRSTVVKLEHNKRESISLQDWLALATVLGVPPIWLLADPRAGTPVPITEGIEVDPWTALLWLTGTQPLDGPGGDAWARAYEPLRQLQILARVLEQYRKIRQTLDLPMVSAEGDAVAGVLSVHGDLAETRRTLEAIEGAQLRAVADQLGQFRQLQLPVPQMPADVCTRAAELGIELPDQEG
jgi:transcriptional regulator with XRE-family HTH domain